MAKGDKKIWDHPSDPNRTDTRLAYYTEDYYYNKHMDRQRRAKLIFEEVPEATIQEVLKSAQGPVAESIICEAKGLTPPNLRSILRQDLEAGRVGSSNWKPIYSAKLRGDWYYFWLGD